MKHLETDYAASNDGRSGFGLTKENFRWHLFRMLVRMDRLITQGSQYENSQYFGSCPYCLNNDGFLNVGRSHWMYCRIHKTRWFCGENLFSCWRNESESDWEENQQYLSTFQNIEPVYLNVGDVAGIEPGKTTNTVQIAAALGYRGYRCLIIDLVPDAGATKHLGVRQNSFAGSLELLTTEETIESLVITDKMPRGVHLIASRRQLAELDKVVSKFAHPTELLERPILRARELYDFVFLDTAPEAGAITTVAAYCTADWFLLSAFPHPLSLGGLSDAFSDIADVRKRKNPNLEVLGVVFTNVDGRTKWLRADLEATVRKALPGREFETVISQAIILPEISGRGKTLFQLPKFNRLPVAQQYLRLSVEVEHRVCNREAFLAGMLGPPDFTVLNQVDGNEAEHEQEAEPAAVVNG